MSLLVSIRILRAPKMLNVSLASVVPVIVGSDRHSIKGRSQSQCFSTQSDGDEFNKKNASIIDYINPVTHNEEHYATETQKKFTSAISKWMCDITMDGYHYCYDTTTGQTYTESIPKKEIE